MVSNTSTPEMIAYESLPPLIFQPLVFFILGEKSSCLFSIVGPGTTNCAGYCQNFILSDFSSSHRRVVNNVWPGTTSYICYFLVMSLGTHNHNPHPPNTQQLPSSKHHSSSWWIQTACMKDAKENSWHMAMGIVICMVIAESIHIHSVPTMSNQMACV